MKHQQKATIGNDEDSPLRIVQDILRLRTVYQFTRDIYIRLIIQRDNYYKNIEINALAGWQPSPGTVVFLGYNDYFRRDSHQKLERFAQGLFFKFAYLIRL